MTVSSILLTHVCRPTGRHFILARLTAAIALWWAHLRVSFLRNGPHGAGRIPPGCPLNRQPTRHRVPGAHASRSWRALLITACFHRDGRGTVRATEEQALPAYLNSLTVGARETRKPRSSPVPELDGVPKPLQKTPARAGTTSLATSASGVRSPGFSRSEIGPFGLIPLRRYTLRYTSLRHSVGSQKKQPTPAWAYGSEVAPVSTAENVMACSGVDRASRARL